jgi:ABC-type multidrug transport system ATPase subunit
VVYEGGLDELRTRAGRRYRLRTADTRRALEICEALHDVSDIELDDQEIGFGIESDATLIALTGALAESGIAIRALVPEQLTLERVFFELTERADARRLAAVA